MEHLAGEHENDLLRLLRSNHLNYRKLPVSQHSAWAVSQPLTLLTRKALRHLLKNQVQIDFGLQFRASLHNSFHEQKNRFVSVLPT
jgi:hypothetical protein